MTVSPSINYNCVVISTPKIEKDKTYTLTMGTETKTITMTELVMSEGTNQRGNPTGMGKGERPKNGGLQQNGIPAFPNGTPPEGFPSMDENEAEKNKPKPTDIPQQS